MLHELQKNHALSMAYEIGHATTKNMIHVILDTNIYLQNPYLDSPAFKALEYLAKKEVLCIHIPYVVEHELLSRYLEEHEENIVQLKKSISILIEYREAMTLVPELTKYLNILNEKDTKEIRNRKKDILLAWMDTVGATQHGLTSTETKNAFNAYFYGKEPFKKLRNKSDIPDSFIYQTVKKLQAKHGDNLYFVGNDNNLREACSSNGISIHESLQGFVHVQAKQYFLLNFRIEKKKNFIRNHLAQYVIGHKNKILEEVDHLLSKDEYSVIDKSIGEQLPQDRDFYAHKCHSLETTKDMDYYENGVFSLRFKAQVNIECSVGAFIDEEYYHNNLGDVVDYATEKLAHILKEESFCFEGRIGFEYSGNFKNFSTEEELSSLLNNPKITISDLENFQILE